MTRSGFTLVEIIVVVAVLVTLLGFSTSSLLTNRNQATLNSIENILAVELHTQQLKSMLGDTEGRASADTYGIYFGDTYYTLFHGAAYNSAAADNFRVNLDTGLRFSSVSFPGSQIIFARGSGEIVSYTPGQDSFTVSQTQENTSLTFTFNRYGVVTQVN